MRPSTLLARLRGRTPAELRDRGGQALAAWTERRGWSADAREPSTAAFLARGLDPAHAPRERTPEALLRHFRIGRRPRFFAGVEDSEGTVLELRRRWPGAVDALVAAADGIRAGRLDLLGYRGLEIGTAPDWHRDVVSGIRAPALHWSRLDYLDPAVAGDHKVTWELNRHHHLVTLGRAYRVTGDERYAETFAAHLGGWMDANPPQTGINWASSLELAFRSIAWTWALHLFRPSAHLTPALYGRALAFLHLQGRHVERNLSTWFSPNTHLTGEALGLFCVGSLFPELAHAARWRARGLAVFAAEMERQVHDDGVYFEQSTWYQRYTADFGLHLCALAALHGTPLDARIPRALRGLLDHLAWITRPDGTTPRVGDDDGGRLLPLDARAPDDFRATLATGAVLFGRPDYRHVAGEAAEETLWLLGAEGLRRFDALAPRAPAETSRAFPRGGVYVMRDGWDRGAHWMRVDCGPHGALTGGHAHADALSIDVAAAGRTLLVDPGTFTYTEPDARDRFRGTAAHNTVTVDDVPSAVPGGAFRWGTGADASASTWIARERFDLFEGEHDGYGRLADPAVHARGILFLKRDYWIVRDHVRAAGAHRAALRLQFAPGITVVPAPHGAAACGVEVSVHGRDASVRIHPGEVSPAYGDVIPAPACMAAAPAPGVLTTFLVPHPSSGERPRIDAVETTAGEAFRVRAGKHDDLAGFAADGALEGGGLSADFDWVWLRRDAASGAVVEYVLAGGTRLRVGGVDLFRAPRRVRFVAARMRDGVLHVDTDTRVSFDAAPLGSVPALHAATAG